MFIKAVRLNGFILCLYLLLGSTYPKILGHHRRNKETTALTVEHIFQFLNSVFENVNKEKVEEHMAMWASDATPGEMTGKDREAMLDHLKIEGKEPENRRECNEVLQKLNTKKLTANQLSEALNMMVFENNGENMDAVTNFFDRNDDGALSVQEFCAMVQGLRHII